MSPPIKLPNWLAVFSGYGYEMLSYITRKPPLTSASWVRVGSHYSWWDSTKARKILGLGQRPIEESLTEAIEWFKASKFV
jgi:hypothetical protein